MSKVTIFLAPGDVMRDFSFVKADKVGYVRAALSRYAPVCVFTSEYDGEDAAEEAFDLTNNPGRQVEREVCYGRGRSVSTGDVIDVDGVKYLCKSAGWAVL